MFSALTLLLAGAHQASAHSYIFSREYEEMRDQVYVYVMPGLLTIQYQSKYYGQIAPHVRNMIDADADTTVEPAELALFLHDYESAMSAALPQYPIYVDGKPFPLRLVDVEFPGIFSDSLLAPLNLKMVFEVQVPQLAEGEHEMRIPPATLFLNGTWLIRMARERVAFTPEQEKAIGRFLLVNAFGDRNVWFTYVHPGYLKHEGGFARIYGVFYDETILKLDPARAPQLTVRFRVGKPSQ